MIKQLILIAICLCSLSSAAEYTGNLSSGINTHEYSNSLINNLGRLGEFVGLVVYPNGHSCSANENCASGICCNGICASTCYTAPVAPPEEEEEDNDDSGSSSGSGSSNAEKPSLSSSNSGTQNTQANNSTGPLSLGKSKLTGASIGISGNVLKIAAIIFIGMIFGIIILLVLFKPNKKAASELQRAKMLGNNY